jgi:DNA polymerase III delta prime subunit
MLEKVRLIWIKGLLEPSLDQHARIELGLEPKPDAVDRPFDLLVQHPEQAPHPLPTGTPISHVFDEAGKALLILGEPGTGKTTLLLELTRDLLDRAAQDERHLIPVVFNLSSWAEQRLALADWLMDELHKRYDVPRKLAKAWVDADLLLPLLDGLDEVATEHREACVEAINAFLSEHGLLPLVVCSRVADYAALTGRLRLPSAVLIQPLSRQQVQHYVEQAGTFLAGLRVVLQDDEPLGELLNTPLMLSIAALAYKGRPGGRDTCLRHRRSTPCAALCSLYRCHVSPTGSHNALHAGSNGTLADVVGEGHEGPWPEYFLCGVDATQLDNGTMATKDNTLHIGLNDIYTLRAVPKGGAPCVGHWDTPMVVRLDVRHGGRLLRAYPATAYIHATR